ncbi:MAG: hypothetical protein IKO61_01470 [Lachnospiraceae bacterium]|nr:hypothetical protein [Lachnospiraceae bacterium]
MRRLKKLAACAVMTLMPLLLPAGSLLAKEAQEQDAVSEIVQDVETIGGSDADTVITLSDGSTNEVDNAVLAVSFEEVYSEAPVSVDVESYEVMYEDQSILLVEPVGASLSSKYDTEAKNGFYAATFTIPGTNKECFLTGLTAASVDDICSKLIAHYERGYDFAIESLDVIDAEKLYEKEGGDDLLCWAATSSNMLHYTGWGKVAGFNNEDEILQRFADNFIDEGFHEQRGIHWFFSGSTGDLDSNVKNLKSYPGSGGYLKGYDYSDLSQERIMAGDWKNGMPNMLNYLKEGCGIGLTVEWEAGQGAHAITLWGMIVDRDHSMDEKAYWDSFIVSDSDTRRPQADTSNRRIQPNTFEIYKLHPYIDEENEARDTFKFYEDSGILTKYTYLKPYTDELPMEKDESASMDLSQDPDFYINGILVSNEKDAYTSEYSCFDSDVYIWPMVANQGDTDYSGELLLTGVLKDSSGNVVKELNSSQEVTLPHTSRTLLTCLEVGKLSPGRYTCELTVNPSQSVKEAYYINNTIVQSFDVIKLGTDISNISIKGSITGKDENGLYNTVLDYGSLKGSQLIENCDSFTLSAAYCYDGNWSDYSRDIISLPEDADKNSLFENFSISALGQVIRFRLSVTTGNSVLNFYSDEIIIPYTGLKAVPTENNVGVSTSRLAADAKTLAEGEYFAFKIVNPTTTDLEELTGSYRVIAQNAVNSEIVLVDSTEVTLKKGSETEEIKFNNINIPGGLSGTYTVAVEVSFEHDNERASNLVNLGSFFAAEKPSAVVSSFYDRVDPNDGYICLREAISYCRDHPGSEITFNPGVTPVNIESPLVIDGDIKINGHKSEDDGSKNSVEIYGNNKDNIFVINKNGSLTMDGVSLSNAHTDESGGAICVNGGKLVMTDSMITQTSSDFKGGAIALLDGHMTLKNVVITSTSSGYGGAVFMTKYSKAELLNCFITGVTSNMGAIYNNNGSLNVINSVIAGNFAAGYSGLNIGIKGSEDTHIVNSIVTNGTLADILGNVQIHASALSSKPTSATCDDLTYLYEFENLFNFSGGGMARITREDSILNFPSIRKPAAEGYYTYVSGGEIFVSEDGVKKTATGVKTSFTDADLSKDMYGAKRNHVYGCYTTITGNISDCSISNVEMQVYTGKEIKPSLTIKDGDTVLKEGTDYELEYTGGSAVGTHEISVSGIGDYTGYTIISYEVVRVHVNYRAYVQKKGWMAYAKDGAMAGTKDNLRMETIQMKLTGNKSCPGGIKYRAYVQKLGWTFWADTAAPSTYAGTKGRALRIESIQLNGYGSLSEAYDVYYRVYCDSYGWLDWAKNGASAGTSGLSKKLRAFQVKLVAKGEKAPGKTAKPYATNKNP